MRNHYLEVAREAPEFFGRLFGSDIICKNHGKILFVKSVVLLLRIPPLLQNLDKQGGGILIKGSILIKSSRSAIFSPAAG